MSSGVVYPVETIPVPSDIQAHTNQLFDFDDEYLVQSDIRQDDFVRIYDRTSVGNEGVANKEQFLLQMNDIAGNSWYCPSQSYLKIDFLIKRGNSGLDPPVLFDGASTFASDIRNIFRRVRFSMGGQTITDIADYFWDLPALDNVFWTQQYTDTVGTQMLCYPTRNNQVGNNQSTGNLKDVCTGAGATATVATNTNTYQNSIGKRSYLSGRNSLGALPLEFGTVLSAFIPLYHISSALQYFTKATTQISWEIEVYRNLNNAINCYSEGSAFPSNDPQFQLVNNGIELWAKRITPTETARLVLTEKLNRGVDMAIKFADLQIYREQIPSGQGSPAGTIIPFNQRITVTASRPVYCVIAFQFPINEERPQFEYDQFSNAFIENISLYVNNVQLPTDRIEMEIDEDINGTGPYPYVTTTDVIDTTRPYYEYLKMCGNYKAPYLTGFGAGAGTLTQQDWKNRAPVFCFDCAAREIGQWSGGASEIRVRGNIKVPSTPAAIRGDTYNLKVLLWTERQMGIHLQNWNSYVGVA